MNCLMLIRERWSHMAPVSGFDPLFHEIQKRIEFNTVSYTVQERSRVSQLVARLARASGLARIPQSCDETSPFIRECHKDTARKVIRRLRTDSSSLVLLSAGENQLASNFLAIPSSLRKRTFVCLHQPPSWFRLNWRTFDALCGLGGIISLCTEQANYLEEICDSPVHQIRHGVNLDFFRPGENCSLRIPRLLFVGQWLRDFALIDAAISQILILHPTVEFDMVVPRATHSREGFLRVARSSRVNWHFEISAEGLRNLYQRSTGLFLPLIDATANNSVVEAMACGLPIISTRVGGIPDYLDPSHSILCEAGNLEEHVEAAVQLLANDSFQHSARIAARRKAEVLLDWSLQADDLTRILSSCS